MTNEDTGQESADTQQLRLLRAKNQNLAQALRIARENIGELKAQLEQLGKPPGSYGVFIQDLGDNTADIFASGRRMRVGMDSTLAASGDLQPGQLVLLNEALTAVRAGGYEPTGQIVTVLDILDGERAIVASRTDEEQIVLLSGPLRAQRLRIGDHLRLDSRGFFAVEKVAKHEVEDLMLEEVPDVDYSDIGGLGPQIEEIRDAVELPFVHPQLYRDHGLKPPKGVLLYGPPGNGKTLIAKAVAKSLAETSARLHGDPDARAYFLNVKGPELLNKYVGETERHIRVIFARAREKALEGVPVIVFFDEMDSLFRTRGTGVSSDVETTIVPQLLAEIDGVETLDNVIIIGASNREDMIDPAILRPGRLDVKIRIERPDEAGAREIFSKYLTVELPLHEEDLAKHDHDRAATVESMINAVVERMYQETLENRFVEVTYVTGEKEIMYFKDFSSGAMIRNIVDRAKKMAIKNFLSDGGTGIKTEYLLEASAQEFLENEDLPNTANPDDWARVSGKRGEKVVSLRTITHYKTSEH